MNRTAESGLEIKPATEPEVAPQPNEYMYYTGGGAMTHTVSDQPNQFDQSHQPQAMGQGRSRAVWVLGIIAVLCLTVAVGAGLGAGLAAQHKSTLSPSSSGAPITIIQTSSAPVTITQSADPTTSTSTPATPPSPTCPAADGSTYVATNKPLQTMAPFGPWQIPNTSLSFEIFCTTNFLQWGQVLDLQVIENISSLNDCLDQCALYNFRTSAINFPARGCTGIAWNRGPYDLCWLKGNVTLGSPKLNEPHTDGAVLLDI